MITVSAAYALRAAATSQPTIYVVSIPSHGAYISSGPVPGLSTTGLIQDRPALAASQVNPLSATGSTGSVGLSLVDISGAVTAMRRVAPVRRKPATVYMGYAGLPWGSDWIVVENGPITKFSRDAGGLIYSLEVSSNLDLSDIEVLDPQAIAAEPWMSGDKSFDGGSLVLRDTDGDSIYDQAILTGNPVDLLLKMLLSGGGNGGGFDVWPAYAGAGLTIDQVDIAWCTAERDSLSAPDIKLYTDGPESVADFMETEVCKALGGYPLASGTGKIRIHFPNPAASPVLAWTDSHLITRPQWDDSSPLYLSHLIYELDDSGDGPQTTIQRASTQFLDQTQTEVREHQITSRGLQTSLGGSSFALSVADSLFTRYGDGPPRVKFAVKMSQHQVEGGDLVTLTTRYYPDWDGRGSGSTRYLEILSAKPGPQRVEIDAIDLTGPLTAGTRAIIAPDTAPNWTSATAADKVYAYIGDQASGQFSDGTTNPYVWS